MRLAIVAAMMVLGCISSAIAQPTPSPAESPTPNTSQSPSPSVQSSEPQDCVFADSRFSEGAQFCVTSQQPLKCENGKWSPATMYCGEPTLRSEGRWYHDDEDHWYHGDEDRGYRGDENHGYRSDEEHGYRGDENHGYHSDGDRWYRGADHGER